MQEHDPNAAYIAANSPFIPTDGMVVIQVIDDADEGLTLTRTKDYESRKGRVLAIGARMITEFNAIIEPPCTVGDVIVHSSMAYETFIIRGVTYHIVPFTRVMGIVPQPAYETDKNAKKN